MSGDSTFYAPTEAALDLRVLGMVIAALGDMKIKNMFMLTGVIAGAAYLQDKGRRDRLFGKARGLLGNAKARAAELANQSESKGA